MDAAPTHAQEEEIARLNAELEQTRVALEAAERQLLELRDWRSTEMGRLERQAHWIERSRIDLDRLMARRSVRALISARKLVRRARNFVLALLHR